MQYLMERPTPTLCRFRVTIDEERRGAARSAVMDMTPESDLEKNDIRAATMEWLVDDCIPEVLQQAGILPLSPVRLLPGKENSRQDKYSFSFEVEALPELDLPEDLSTLAVEVEEPLPDPREFRHAVLQAQRSRAVLHPVEEKRLPQDGDVLRLNISAEADGKDLPDMRHDDFTMKLHPVTGAPSEVEALARSLHAGEKMQTDVPCPGNYPDPSLRGRNITMQVELVSINTEVLPPFDEGLAEQLGFSSLEKLKNSIFAHIMGEKIKNIQSRAQKRLIESLLENREFSIPPAIMSLNRQDCEQELATVFQRQGKSEEEIRRLMADMEKELNIQAEERARMQVLLLAVAEHEKLVVSREEADRQILRLAEKTSKNYDKLHDAVYKSRLIDELHLRLLATKALQLLYRKVGKIVVDSNSHPIPVPETGKQRPESTAPGGTSFSVPSIKE